MLRRYVLPWIAFLVYRLWTWTWRMEIYESEGLKKALAAREPVIFAHWHGDELKVLQLVKRYRIATMTSTSKDGELIDFTIRKLGGVTSRGSSTRGGISALKGLIRMMKTGGFNASMAVDGPKGPIYKAKPGVFELSRLAKAVIVPMGAYSPNSIIFHKSWNKASLPKPFAKVKVWFSDPLPAIHRDQEAHDPQLALQLESAIAKACQLATQHLR